MHLSANSNLLELSSLLYHLFVVPKNSSARVVIMCPALQMSTNQNPWYSFFRKSSDGSPRGRENRSDNHKFGHEILCPQPRSCPTSPFETVTSSSLLYLFVVPKNSSARVVIMCHEYKPKSVVQFVPKIFGRWSSWS